MLEESEALRLPSLIWSPDDLHSERPRWAAPYMIQTVALHSKTNKMCLLQTASNAVGICLKLIYCNKLSQSCLVDQHTKVVKEP